MKSLRVDYDGIAPLYDSSPYRERTVDPELLAFIAQHPSCDRPSVLDVGCGTGNQLVANRATLSSAMLVGVDKSLGMLQQAQPKAPGIAWVRADGSVMPFQSDSFDFLTCQFAFHHLRDKAGMLREAFRVLRSEGRLVLRNMCPQECADWLYYEYFPEAWALDLADFWAPETISAEMEICGFVAVSVQREHLHFAQDLRAWFDTVRRRDTCSQLLAIGDGAYEAGLRRLAQELAEQSGPLLRDDYLCLVTIRGDKPRGRQK